MVDVKGKAPIGLIWVSGNCDTSLSNSWQTCLWFRPQPPCSQSASAGNNSSTLSRTVSPIHNVLSVTSGNPSIGDCAIMDRHEPIGCHHATSIPATTRARRVQCLSNHVLRYHPIICCYRILWCQYSPCQISSASVPIRVLHCPLTFVQIRAE
jgi:hypothetical protein